eukprot:324563-Amphidinium_carterae.1
MCFDLFGLQLEGCQARRLLVLIVRMSVCVTPCSSRLGSLRFDVRMLFLARDLTGESAVGEEADVWT